MKVFRFRYISFFVLNAELGAQIQRLMQKDLHLTLQTDTDCVFNSYSCRSACINISEIIWMNKKKFLSLRQEINGNMAQVEYITIKNASRKVLNKMREIGEKKAQRLQELQERWEAGDIKDVEVVQL